MQAPSAEKRVREAYDTMVLRIINDEKESNPRKGQAAKFFDTLKTDLQVVLDENLQQPAFHGFLQKMDERAASQTTLPGDLIHKIPKKSIDEECLRLEAIYNEEKVQVDELERQLSEIEELKRNATLKPESLRSSMEEALKFRSSDPNAESVKKWVADHVG